jgi:hypothetical protein
MFGSTARPCSGDGRHGRRNHRLERGGRGLGRRREQPLGEGQWMTAARASRCGFTSGRSARSSG